MKMDAGTVVRVEPLLADQPNGPAMAGLDAFEIRNVPFEMKIYAGPDPVVGAYVLRVVLHVADRDDAHRTGVLSTDYIPWSESDTQHLQGDKVAERLHALVRQAICHELDENTYFEGQRRWDPHPEGQRQFYSEEEPR